MFNMLGKAATITTIICVTVIVIFGMFIVATTKNADGTINATFLAAMFGFLTPTITGFLVLIKQEQSNQKTDQMQQQVTETNQQVQSNTQTLSEVHEKVNGNFDNLLAKVEPKSAKEVAL